MMAPNNVSLVPVKLALVAAAVGLAACGVPDATCGPTSGVVQRAIDGDTIELTTG